VISAVDTTVILDIVGSSAYEEQALRALRQAEAEGGLVACEVVWAEVGAAFPRPEEGDRVLEWLRIGFDAMDRAVARTTGSTWRAYRQAGGPRSRVVADFLIGAHAAVRADRLVTRDRGFFRSYFSDLEILDPTSA